MTKTARLEELERKYKSSIETCLCKLHKAWPACAGDHKYTSMAYPDEILRLIARVKKLEAALEFAINKYDQHKGAYDEDIFPDDGRQPCETTSGRMGRHMLKCFNKYLGPARAALSEAGGE